jgi:two-component system, OmpR family, phosphate regulon response regulator PhoB
MRLRMCRQLAGSIDGVSLDRFRDGAVYDVGIALASVFLAEGWAEPAADDAQSGSVRPATHTVAAVVLVVEDEPDVRHLVAAVLHEGGYEVLQARHGGEAISQLCEHRPDLIILDLHMPVMNGWQFCAERQRLADGRLSAIPVILLSGLEAAPSQVFALRAAGLVRKPFEPDQLLNAAQMALPH